MAVNGQKMHYAKRSGFEKDRPRHGNKSSHSTCATVLSAGELQFGF
jgi:hypothetical protein